MKKVITMLSMVVFASVLLLAVQATTCAVASSATVPVGVDEDITVSCSDIGSGYTVTISPSGFSGSCLSLDSESKQVTSSNPSTTFTATGVSMACVLNVPGRTVTWTFTHSNSNSIASKTTVYNIIPTPSITPTFDSEVYSVPNTTMNVSITVGLTTGQSEVDIRNINIIISTNINGTVEGLENKSGITIDVSESTTQYVTWNLELPPMPPGMEFDFNISVSADNANDAMANTIINVTAGGASADVSIGLNTGWNLVSVPVQAADMSAATLFGSVSNFNIAWGYNASDTGDPWEVYDPGLPPAARDLVVVNPDYGYWVKVTGTDYLNVSGDTIDSLSITLRQGWNLVGYPFVTSRSAATGVSGLSNFKTAWGFYSSDVGDPWKVYDTALPPAARDMTNFEPGYGYWIKMNSQEPWTLS